MRFIALIFFAAFTSSLNAEIFRLDTNSEFNDMTFIQFVGVDLVSDVLNNEINLEAFSNRIKKEYKEFLMETFQCASLTDPKITKECAVALENRDESLHLMPQLPVNWSEVEGSRLSVTLDQIKKILDKTNSTIHENLRAFILDGYLGYGINEMAFYINDFKEKFETSFQWLVNYILSKNREIIEECSYKAEVNTFDIMANENFVVDSKFDSKKCKHRTSILKSVLDSYMGLFYIEGEFTYPISSLHPNYTEIAKKIMDKIDPLRLYIESLRIYKSGDKLNLELDKRIVYFLRHLEKKIIYDEDQLLKVITRLAITDPQNKVRYDGSLGVHDYTDINYLRDVTVLSLFMSHKPELVKKIVQSSNLQEIFKDTNTVDELSRLEVIDLTSNLLYRIIKNYSRERNTDASIKNYLKGTIQYSIGRDEELISPLFFNQRKPEDAGPILYCAYPKMIEAGFETYPFAINYIQTLNYNWVDNINTEESDHDGFESEFICAEKEFNLKIEKRMDAPLKLPEKFEIIDGYVDIVVPYSLTEVLNDKFKNALITYFRGLRYKVKHREVTDVKKFMSKEIITTDVIIPAGHSIQSRDMNLGTVKGDLYIMTRKKRHGDKYGVRIKLILPRKGEKNARLNIAELSAIYKSRIAKELQSLFVFVISCNSESNLGIWSLIYRRAFESIESDKGQMPYVIASERGFDTSNNMDLAGSIFYPSDLADMLAQGFKPHEIYSTFLTKEYDSIGKELLSRLGRAWSQKGAWRDLWDDLWAKPEDSTFEPVYNFSEEYRDMTLRMSGKRFTVRSEGELLYDETF